MYRHLLVPIDGSELSVETAAKATAFARTVSARITFLYARPDDADAELEQSVRAVVQHAVANGRALGVPCLPLITNSSRPYQAIIDAAGVHGCDLIFMASHGQRGARGLGLGPQTQAVLSHAMVPVLVAAVETNMQSPEMARAVHILREEHRSLAAVVHGLSHLVQAMREQGVAPDLPLLDSHLSYLRTFPLRLHHPKEDTYLFAALREQTGEYDPVLSELQADHATEAQRVADLDAAFAALRQGHGDGLQRFAGEVDRYAQATWHHMTLEEKVVLPAAMRHLKAAAWAPIADAFEGNRDPRFGADITKGYAALFERIRELEAREAWNVGAS